MHRSVCALLAIASLLVLPATAYPLHKEGVESLQTFSRVLHHILAYYVEAPEESALIQGAIRGLFETLDPHSSYLSPRVFNSLKAETGGRFGGIGLEVVLRHGWLTVIAPVDGSPAALAGIKAGDRVVKIDGVSTKRMNVSEAVAKMRGRPGSTVTLTILRRGSRLPVDMALKRATIQVPSVRGELMAPGYPIVRITSFREQTYHDFLETMKTLTREAAIRGLVLDLRNNPGGLLDQAVQMSDYFLRKGVIVTTESRGKEIDRQEAHDEGLEPEYPVAILVNGGSASAAEIVTGALQDHGRAVVLGSQTFGKGSVQTVIGFENGAALKLTVARYYTPRKRSIQAFGIGPDIVLPEYHPESEEQGEAEQPRERGPVRESRLPRHLKGRPAKSGRSRSNGVRIPAISVEEAGADYQRAIALHLLQDGTVQRLTHLH
ncbi:MAG: S41 family peptidase [Deltaproteobacteria bacterium]|nr:S41 family peptidase [Deltaproteobacteria bacterium]